MTGLKPAGLRDPLVVGYMRPMQAADRTHVADTPALLAHGAATCG